MYANSEHESQDRVDRSRSVASIESHRGITMGRGDRSEVSMGQTPVNTVNRQQWWDRSQDQDGAWGINRGCGIDMRSPMGHVSISHTPFVNMVNRQQWEEPCPAACLGRKDTLSGHVVRT